MCVSDVCKTAASGQLFVYRKPILVEIPVDKRTQENPELVNYPCADFETGHAASRKHYRVRTAFDDEEISQTQPKKDVKTFALS